MFVWWRASLFHHTNVCKISLLWGAISLLVFNKSLSNLAILLISRSSFQWCWWLFCNVSMPKVEKNCEKVYQERLWELIKWPSKEKCFDILSNSPNLFCQEMYRDLLGEFVCGYFLPGDPVLLLHPFVLVCHVFPRNKIKLNTEHHYNISSQLQQSLDIRKLWSFFNDLWRTSYVFSRSPSWTNINK